MTKQAPFLGFCFLTLAIALCLLLRNEPFFWDTVQLGAMQGDWFYQQNFSTLLLPDRIDSGHVPAFGCYLSAAWMIFEQNLLVSHLAMAPWIMLVLWQCYRLCSFKFNRWILLSLLLFLADPVLSSQLTLISPDVVLVGAFLLSINSILRKQPIYLAIGILLLGLISMRGMLVGFGLFIWQVYLAWEEDRKISLPIISQLLLPYLLGACTVLAYLLYHYQSKGWIVVHENSPWAESFAIEGTRTWLKQIAIIAWRVLDFGRVFLLAILVIAWQRTGWIWNAELRKIVALVLIMAVLVGLPGVFSPGLAQHRYLLPFSIGITWLAVSLLRLVATPAWRAAYYVIAIIGLLSGNFWIYPEHIAQGWDASLAHKFYFKGKHVAEKFLNEENIISTEIGTVFPEVGPIHFRKLNQDTTGFAPLNLQHQHYIYYSNVMNDFTDEQLLLLQKDWHPIFEYRAGGVKTSIYQKN